MQVCPEEPARVDPLDPGPGPVPVLTGHIVRSRRRIMSTQHSPWPTRDNSSLVPTIRQGPLAMTGSVTKNQSYKTTFNMSLHLTVENRSSSSLIQSVCIILVSNASRTIGTGLRIIASLATESLHITANSVKQQKSPSERLKG